MRSEIPVAVELFPVIMSLICVIVASAQAVRAEDSPVPAEAVKNWLEEHIPLMMAESKMPGFSIAVVKDGQTIYAAGFGSRDPKRNLPATPDTLYGIGSITKSFVAIGIMQLVEEGKISLDDPVSKHVPLELGLPDKPITIHHLLTHSLGVPSLASSNVALYRGLGLDTGVPFGSAADFYRFVNGATDEIIAEPGQRYFYHNAAWRMLGHIVQEKSGLPFHVYMKEKVINPLGMQRTTLNVADFASDPDRIVPHVKRPDGTNEPKAYPYPNPEDNPEFSFLSAAGGVISSVHEMARYLNMQIEKGRFDSGQLAGSGSFATMQQLHIEIPSGHYGQNGYGYGLSITPDFLGHKLISHGGSIIVSTAHMAFIPDLKAGVIMMGNSSGMSYAPIAESVFALLMDKDPAEVVPALRIKQRMNRLKGRYEVYRGLQALDVVARNGLLYLESNEPFDAPESIPLIPVDPLLGSTDFYTLNSGIKTPVEFKFRDNGQIDLIWGRYCFHKTN